MQLDLHRPKVSLAGFRQAIEAEVDRMALVVGELLYRAREQHPTAWVRWVEDDLPFSLDTARRLVAIYLAYDKLPAELMSQLPRPWQALFALRKLDQKALQSAIDAGDLTPSTTIARAEEIGRVYKTGDPEAWRRRETHHRADIAAGALMDCSVKDLHPMVLRALLKWLHAGGGL